MHPLHILIVGFCPPQGVMADYFCQIASDLSTSAEVSVLCPKELELTKGRYVRRYTFPYNKKKLLTLLSGETGRMLHSLQKSRFDVVFFFTQNILNVPVSLALRRTRQAMWWHEPIKAGRTTLLKQPLYALSDAVLTRNCQNIIIACENMRSSIRPALLSKVHAIPLPFLEDFEFKDDEIVEVVPAADLVFFGNIEAYKGLDILSDALSLLYAQGMAVTLCVIGKGDLAKHCPRLVDLAGRFPDRIHFRNRYEPYTVVVQSIRASRAVVLPYLTASGTGTIPIAYRQCKPVIATRAGCLSDYVRDGHTGVIVEPGDSAALAEAIKRLLVNMEFALNLGKEGFHDLENRFSQVGVTNQLLSVFAKDQPRR